MTDPNYTHIAVLLDRSGSMASIRSDMEGGFDAFLDSQRKVGGRATLSLSQFNNRASVVHGPRTLNDVPPLVLQPYGSTALLDALGDTITRTGEWLASLDESYRPGKVIFVTITDGEENASREWTKKAVFDLISAQRNDYKWEFMFLGANQDAITVANDLGMSRGTTITYDTAKTGQTYTALSSAVTRSRTGATADFTNAERSSVT